MKSHDSPLQVALAAPRPIHTDRRPVTVAQHEHYRRTLAPPPPDDDLEAYTADPLVERYARPCKENKAARVLAILDQLERSPT